MKGPVKASQLLSSKYFLPYFVTQFLGAFNDNLFKNALLILIAYSGTRSVAEVGLFNNLAAGLFILPFFLFAAKAGVLTDTHDKARIMRRLKWSELAIAIAAIPALLSQNVYFMLVVLSLFGLQSAFFAPSKYSILPQHLTSEQLVMGNGLVQMGTFVSILIGTLTGGFLAASQGGLPWLCGLIVLTALVGVIAVRFVPDAPPEKGAIAQPNMGIYKASKELIQAARKDKKVFLSILAVSWFWFLGSVLLTQLPGYSREVLYLQPQVVSIILALFSLGIGAGSVSCGKIAKGRIELALAPIGSIGLSVFGHYFASMSALGTPDALFSLAQMSSAAGIEVSMVVFFMGVSGGLYIVPIMTWMQSACVPSERGRTMAVNSLMNAAFMVAAAIFSIILLSVFKLSISTLINTVMVLNLLFLVFLIRREPGYFARLLMVIISHIFYRVGIKGSEHIPEKGGLIITSNHVSYFDVFLLGAGCYRPLRYIMYKPIYDFWMLHWLFKTLKAIPIDNRHADPEGYQRGMDEIDKALRNGEALIIFPEGKLSPDGYVHEFKHGIDIILKKTAVPVVPAAINGLWGGFFSRVNGRAFTRPFKRFYTRASITYYPKWEAENVNSKALEEYTRERVELNEEQLNIDRK